MIKVHQIQIDFNVTETIKRFVYMRPASLSHRGGRVTVEKNLDLKDNRLQFLKLVTTILSALSAPAPCHPQPLQLCHCWMN